MCTEGGDRPVPSRPTHSGGNGEKRLPGLPSTWRAPEGWRRGVTTCLPRERVARPVAPVPRSPPRLRASSLGLPGRPCPLLGPRFPWRAFATHSRTIKVARPYRTPFAFRGRILTPTPCLGVRGGGTVSRGRAACVTTRAHGPLNPVRSAPAPL